jgi:hypothetical protein
MAWYIGHSAVSPGQHNFGVFLSTGHRAVSHRPRHKITVSNRQKHHERCFSDQATNEECPTNKFPINKKKFNRFRQLYSIFSHILLLGLSPGGVRRGLPLYTSCIPHMPTQIYHVVKRKNDSELPHETN